MQALSGETFLKKLEDAREAVWAKMTAERKSYGAEKPLTADLVVRRLQFGVVMERKAAEVTAPWVAHVPDFDIQQPLSEYVKQANDETLVVTHVETMDASSTEECLAFFGLASGASQAFRPPPAPAPRGKPPSADSRRRRAAGGSAPSRVGR